MVQEVQLSEFFLNNTMMGFEETISISNTLARAGESTRSYQEEKHLLINRMVLVSRESYHIFYIFLMALHFSTHLWFLIGVLCKGDILIKVF